MRQGLLPSPARLPLWAGEKVNPEDPTEINRWADALDQQEAAIVENPTELLGWLEASWQMIETTLTTWTVADLTQTYRRIREGKMYVLSRQWTIWRILSHDPRVSTTDPDATIMLHKDGSHLGYQTHYVVDGGKARIILTVLVTPAEVMENQPMLDLIFRTRFRWKLWPRQVTGDTKYGTEENIVALENQHIRAYVALPDNDHRTEFFSSDRFRYEAERDVYICPAGKELHFFQAQSTDRQRRYRARAKDCNHCPLKAQCTTSKQGRSLCRSVDEEYLDRVRGYHTTEAYKKAYRKRSVWVEPLFAEAKD